MGFRWQQSTLSAMATAAPDIRDVILRSGSTLRLRPPDEADVDLIVDFFTGMSERSVYRASTASRAWRRDRRAVPRARLGGQRRADRHDLGGRGGREGRRARELRPAARPGVRRGRVRGRGRAPGPGRRHAAPRAAGRAAAEVGISTFVAEVMPDNAPMLRVFEDAGFAVSRRLEGGTTEVRLEIAPTDQYRAAVDERDHLAVAASLAPFFAPKTVAVIGASTRRGSIGGELFRNILDSDFDGIVYPVNPKAPVGRRRDAPTASIADIPDPSTWRSSAFPPSAVLAEAEAALAKGTRALCVISAGFAETGVEGERRQEAAARARARARRAADRPELPRDLRRRRRAQRDLRAAQLPRREHRLLVAERRARPRAARAGGGARARALRRSSRSATRPTSPPTTCSSTGRTTRRPT